MRLLNSSTGQMKEFLSDEDVPPYAILSHTWGEGETSLADWENLSPGDLREKAGYRKIEYTCKQAKREGYSWVWADTCCIDKSSSAELSEAINSMFRWYQQAAVCYVYLSDIADPPSDKPADVIPELSKSRWFTRGWTLQELIAPKDVAFYSMTWRRLGSKSELCGSISEITGVDESFLRGQNLATASISKRMSWAANRKTTRREDLAYCLLGMFDINMPLLYGEGTKAFARLQIELMKTYPHDHTLFAWGVIVPESSLAIPASDYHAVMSGETIPAWNSKESERRLLGLFAHSPKDYEFSGKFAPLQLANMCYTYADPGSGDILALPTARGKGFHVHFPVHYCATRSLRHWDNPKIVQVRPMRILHLLCGIDGAEPTNPGFLGIPVQPWGTQCFGRTRELVLSHTVTSSYWDLIKMAKPTYIEPENPPQLLNGDIIFRRVHNLNTNKWSDDGKISFSHTFLWGDAVVTSGVGKTTEFRISYDYKSHDSTSKGGFGVGIFLTKGEPDSPGVVSVVFRWVPIWEGRVSGGWENALPKDVTQSRRCIMADPMDAWDMDMDPFPHIRVEVQRMELGNGNGSVHVVDVVFKEREGNPSIPAPPIHAETTSEGGGKNGNASKEPPFELVVPPWQRVTSRYQDDKKGLKELSNGGPALVRLGKTG